MNKQSLPIAARIPLMILSFLLCVLLFFSTMVTILVADLKLFTSKDGLQTLIKEVLFSTSAPARAPVFSPAGLTPGRARIRLAEADVTGEAQSAIIDTLYGMLEEQFEGELPISKDQVEAFISDSTLPEFISDKVAGVVSDVISGESTTTITKDEVVGLLEENKELIESTFQVEIPQEVIESVGDWVEENKIMDTVQQEISNAVGIEPVPGGSDEGITAPTGSSGSSSPSGTVSGIKPADKDVVLSIVNGETTDLGVSELLSVVRVITATETLLICIGICLALSALLFLTNWGSPVATLRCSGIVYLLAGILFLIPTVIAVAAPSLFSGLDVAGRIIQQVLSMAGTVSVSVAVFGLVLIIGSAVLGSILRKKAAPAAPAAIAAEE